MKWLKIALRNIIRNFRRSITAILTVAIASTALISGYAYMNYSYWGLSRSIIQGGTGNMHIADSRFYDDFENTQLEFGLEKDEVTKVIKDITADRGVRQVLQRINFSGIVSNGEISTVFIGKGIDSRAENRLRAGNVAGRYIKGKRMNDKNGIYQIELAVDLARKLKVGVGDSVTMLSSTTSGGINALDATVSGIYSSGIPEKDRVELKVPIELAQELIETDKISYMVVQLRDIEATEKYIPQVKNSIKDYMKMKTWWEIEPYFVAVQNILTNIFSVMGIIILLVVMLSVTNVMNTSVMERVHEVGTLRAFGISRPRLKLNFIYEGLIIATIGSLMGVIISLVLTMTIDKLGIMMPPPPGRSDGYPLLLMPTFNSIVIVVGLMLVISAMASYIPVNTIVKRKVLENLNHV